MVFAGSWQGSKGQKAPFAIQIGQPSGLRGKQTRVEKDTEGRMGNVRHRCNDSYSVVIFL